MSGEHFGNVLSEHWRARCWKCGWTVLYDDPHNAHYALARHLEQSGASESAPTNVPEAANRKRGNAPGAPTARTS